MSKLGKRWRSVFVFGLVLAACHSHDEVAPVDASLPSPIDASANVSAVHAAIGNDASAVSDAEPSEIDAAIVPKAWGTAKRFSAQDGSFSVLFPGDVFVKTSTKKDTLSLISKIHETDGIQGIATYAMKFARVHTSKPAAVSGIVDPQTFKDAFPDGTEKSFHASPNFIDAEKGANGASGYRVSMGVEGIGEISRVFSTRDGSTWRVDCSYCCGMVEPEPRITMADQMDLCDDVVHVFQAEH